MRYLLIIYSFITLTNPIFAQNNGILYLKIIKGKYGWYKKSDDKKDWKYSGEIKNGKPNGTGIMLSPFGRYEGEVKNGLLHGQGTYSFKSGRKRVGEFRKGKPWNLKNYDENGEIESEWIEGKKLKKYYRERLKEEEYKESKLFNYRVRALLGILPGEANVSNNSILFICSNYGFGINQSLNEITSSSNNKYKMTNSSIDLSYTFGNLWDLTAGIGYVFEGKGEISIPSSATKYETKNVSGFGFFGTFGREWFSIETLIGMRFDRSSYSQFKSTNKSEVVSIEETLSVSSIKWI